MGNNANETLKEHSNWGGKRPGAGMPLGMKTKKVREKIEAETYFKERVINSIEGLVNSQMNLAKGVQFLYKIHHEKDKNGVEHNSKPELVTSQVEIENYLADDYDEDCNYYFITTEKPDNKALDSLVDRVFGKAKQNISVEGNMTISGFLNKLKENYGDGTGSKTGRAESTG